MAMEKIDHMKDALAARRGKGLDILIGLGEMGHKEEGTGEASHEQMPRTSGRGTPPFEHDGKVEGTDLGEHEDMGTPGAKKENLSDVSRDYKRSDLAPAPQSKEAASASLKSGEGQHQSIQDSVVGGQHAMAPGDVHTNDDTRASLMGNLSETDLRDMANRKPRSLMERAKQEAFKKKV